MTAVTVLGATGLIGHFLLPALADKGYQVTAVSRNEGAGSPGISWMQRDISRNPLTFTGDETLISLAPIWVLGRMLHESDSAPGRIIAFSSTSAISKINSPDPAERKTAEMLRLGETLLRDYAEKHGIGWTILRPTMVYGAGLDKNVAVIAGFIERYRFFPLFGEACGKRSPVHAADLANAALACLTHQTKENSLYALSGGNVISYREMVMRIFEALGHKQRTVRIPLSAARAAIRMVALLPRYSHLLPSMANRTSQDLVFGSGDAIRDFGYSPRPFRPERADLVRAD